ncbi:ornithine carbamoyltransferase [Phosphitispora fastidiosa]|uniref:ornithine carbamoyltransferase n=1 Tax=Phosphitispora fastidiosa TaxID=2837202 RepID=UPI001E56F026|nr:ornithine carbamoyltransferase [Phosphitispora fastidiosa]MBU7007404.1 ornithine carbamoyltransferase [Phosphitispora fastidiosa]
MNSLHSGLRGKDLLALYSLTREEIWAIMKVAQDLKTKQKKGEAHPILNGKTLGMIFTKSSTRTRVSFEVAMHQLGGYPLFLSGQELQLGRGETIADTAKVLSRYLDGIMIRTFAHSDVEELAKYASIPIINGLTDLNHPCQILADFQTILEHKGCLEGLKLAYVGDGNNVCHSLLNGCAKVGMHISAAVPEGYEPSQEIVRIARADAVETRAVIEITDDPFKAVKDADIVYTDVWASMGQEEEHAERLKIFEPYQVNEELVSVAKPDYLFMHCLPAHRGEEVSAGVIDGPNSVVFDEAENRLHAQKAVLALTMI